jgi:hypothetical protein
MGGSGKHLGDVAFNSPMVKLSWARVSLSMSSVVNFDTKKARCKTGLFSKFSG